MKMFISAGIEAIVSKAMKTGTMPNAPLVNLKWTNYPQLDINFAL